MAKWHDQFTNQRIEEKRDRISNLHPWKVQNTQEIPYIKQSSVMQKENQHGSTPVGFYKRHETTWTKVLCRILWHFFYSTSNSMCNREGVENHFFLPFFAIFYGSRLSCHGRKRVAPKSIVSKGNLFFILWKLIQVCSLHFLFNLFASFKFSTSSTKRTTNDHSILIHFYSLTA